MLSSPRNDRVIALIDMDCFYCQVEQREKPELWGKPVAVVQYNQYRGGGIIAISYEARAYGKIKRGMRGDQAKEICPELTVCQVPISQYAEKAELGKYRDASAEVFDVLCNFDDKILVERASIDEAYLDLTALVDLAEKEEDYAQKFSSSCEMLPGTHIANGFDTKSDDYDREKNLKSWLSDACQKDRNQLRLAIGAQIVEEIRAQIKEKTQFFCSAGIAPNKILAKLVCSRHKPRQQTVIASDFIIKLFESTKITDIRGLGGKLGHQLSDRYGVKMMSELAKVDRADLMEHFPHSANFIELICQGIDEEPVRPRDKQLSIAVSRNFQGKTALSTVEDVRTWLRKLVNDLCARIAADQIKNKRTAQSLSCGCTQEEQSVRTTSLKSYSNESVFKSAWSLLQPFNKSTDEKWFPPIRNIHVSAHHFKEGIEKPTKSITNWLSKGPAKNEQEEAREKIEEEKMEVDIVDVEKAFESDSDHSFVFLDEEDDQPSTSTKMQLSEEEDGLEKASKGIKEEMTAKVSLKEKPSGDTEGFDSKIESSANTEIPVEEERYMPDSLKSIPESVLESMPPHIKKELMSYYGGKASASDKNSKKSNSNSPVASKIARSSKTIRKTTPKKVTSKKVNVLKSPPKKISDFFSKK